jgi:hypothetical protein
MKKLILLFALCFALKANSQSIDTVKSAILVNPVVVNSLQKDTAFQVTWSLFGISRDSSQGCNSYVQIFDRKAKKISDMNVPIPAATLLAWGPDSVIDNYILTFLGLSKK